MRRRRSPCLSLATIRRVLTRLLREADGSEAIEFAIVANALLLFLLCTVEFGRLYWTQSELQYAAEAAARAATVYTVNNPSATPAAIQTAAQTQGAASAYSLSVTPTFVLTAYNATAIPPAPSCGNQINVSYPFSFIVTGLFPFSITLTATACHQG